MIWVTAPELKPGPQCSGRKEQFILVNEKLITQVWPNVSGSGSFIFFIDADDEAVEVTESLQDIKVLIQDAV